MQFANRNSKNDLHTVTMRRVLAYTCGLNIMTADEIRKEIAVVNADPEIKGTFKREILNRYAEALANLKQK